MRLIRRIPYTLLSGIFVSSGWDAAARPELKVKQAEAVTAPIIRVLHLDTDTEQLVRVNGTVQVVAGLMLAGGVLPRIAAGTLAVSLVPTTLGGHRFWEEIDADLRAAQRTQFMKNLAMIGGLIVTATRGTRVKTKVVEPRAAICVETRVTVYRPLCDGYLLVMTSPELPEPRGPVSEALIDALRGAPGPFRVPDVDGADLLTDDDAQLALTCCYELHYESFAGVDDGWEWSPDLLALRGRLEQAFVGRLDDEVGAPPATAPRVPSCPRCRSSRRREPARRSRLSWSARATYEHLREFCVHRSEYQRKEADPHTWMIPRLRGRAKAAAVTIQYDEYGEGRADAMHAELFATTMRALDLDPTYGAYRDLLPARRWPRATWSRCSGSIVAGAPRASVTSRCSR